MSPGTGEDDLGVPGLTEPERIGAGGFAVVYRAFQPAFRRPVAVKVLTVDIDERARRRFERECQALGALSEHPGIVTVHDAGFTSGGRPYLVMSHLPGGSLADRLDRSGALPWPEVLRLAQPLAQALAAAHAAGITHCDLKPANVLTRADGSPQLADFGIARIAGEEITATASVTASFPYAAPEVVGGQTPDAASDVYSFGATLHELMAGRPPFAMHPGEALPSLVRRILEEPAPDLHAHGVPADLAALVQRCLAKDPGRRPRSPGELADTLAALAADPPPTGEGAAPPERGPSGAAVTGDRPVTAETAVRQGGYQPAAVSAAASAPTHRVPWTGMHAWPGPDLRLPVAAVLDPDLDVAVLGWHGDWAHVRCSNGWEAWVDGRLLVPLGW